MGMDVTVISNHDINFLGRDPSDVVEEVLFRLNAIEYDGFSNHLMGKNFDLQKGYDNKTRFFVPEEDGPYDFQTEDYIDIRVMDGDDCETKVLIDKYQCTLLCCNRYKEWCIQKSYPPYDWRKDWRRYFWLTLKALGGDRVIYLADHCHPLEAFDGHMPFEKMEQGIANKFGPPAESLAMAYNNWWNGETDQSIYYIDYFDDFS